MREFLKLCQIALLCTIAYFAMQYNYSWVVVFPFLLILVIVVKSQTAIHYKKTVEYALRRFGLFNISCGPCGRIICHTTVKNIVEHGFNSINDMELKIYEITGIIIVIKIENNKETKDAESDYESGMPNVRNCKDGIEEKKR